MIEGTIEFRVDKGREEAFAYLSDLENAPEWVPDLLSVEKVSSGGIEVGTLYEEVVQMGKRRHSARIVVSEYDPPHAFTHKGQAGKTEFTGRFEFHPDGDGTRVVHSYSVKMTGLARLMTPFSKKWIQQNTTAGIEALKQKL